MDTYENPMDKWVIESSSGVVKWLHESLGMTPNAVTILSMALAILGMVFLWRGGVAGFVGFLIAFALSYWMDDLDGVMARRYKLTSDIGEILDHVSDALGFVGVVFVLAVRYKAFARTPLLMAILILSAVIPITHYTCANKQCGNTTGAIGLLTNLCPGNEKGRCIAKFLTPLGALTYQLIFYALVIVIATICSSPKTWNRSVTFGVGR